MNKVLGELWSFFKLNFKWILVAGAFLFLYMRGCFGPRDPQVPIVVHDTVTIIHYYQGQPYTPPVINILPAKPVVINQPVYKPDTSSIQALRSQFEALVVKHTQQNIYNDTLRIDTLGYVNVRDTVSENSLTQRSFNYQIRERQIITTKTLPVKLKNQLFIGGGIGIPLSLGNTIDNVKAGLLFKNKRDNILGAGVTYFFPTKSPGAEVSYYLKIKL